MKAHSALRSSGASMIEFVILLPLFLFTCLFLIWFGAMMNARASLASAVTNAVRLASTRGRGALYQTFSVNNRLVGAIGVLDEVHAYFDPATGTIVGAGTPGQRVIDLMTYNLGTGVGDPFEGYSSWGGGSYQLKDLFKNPALPSYQINSIFDLQYPEYSYAITYAAQSMKMSVGGELKFPCDPRDPDNGEGCLLCRPVHPINLTDTPVEPANWEWVGKRIAIRCDYRPSSYIIAPLLRMLSIMTGGIIGNTGGLQVISFAEYSDRIMPCQKMCVGNPCVMKICCPDDSCI